MLEVLIVISLVFVPMLGDSFFTRITASVTRYSVSSRFRLHAWGFFFHYLKTEIHTEIRRYRVFVPMLGDSFFTAGLGCPTGWALYGPFAAGISN